jgi:hypothetical protein
MISSLQLGRLNQVHTELFEVVTLHDDVRHCGNSGLSADVKFSAEFDPMRNWANPFAMTR